MDSHENLSNNVVVPSAPQPQQQQVPLRLPKIDHHQTLTNSQLSNTLKKSSQSEDKLHSPQIQLTVQSIPPPSIVETTKTDRSSLQHRNVVPRKVKIHCDPEFPITNDFNDIETASGSNSASIHREIKTIYFQKHSNVANSFDETHSKFPLLNKYFNYFISIICFIFKPIFELLLKIIKIIYHVFKMITFLLTCYGETKNKVAHTVTLFCFISSCIYGCFYMIRLKELSFNQMKFNESDILLLFARITGKWFTLCVMIAYLTSLRTVTSELSRANASSRLGIGWRGLHVFLMKQAFYVALLHGLIHEIRKTRNKNVSPLGVMWEFERCTGNILTFCFICQSSQGYLIPLLHYFKSYFAFFSTINGLQIRENMIFKLKQWFRHSHHRSIHFVFMIVLFLHTAGLWMIVAYLLWNLDYWLHCVEIHKIAIFTDDKHVTIKFKPKKIADFPLDFGNYVQLSYKIYSASYTSVSENDWVVVKMSRDCVMAKMLKQDNHIEDNGEINTSLLNNFKIHGPYRSNPSVVNTAEPLLIFTSGVGKTVATSAIEYYSINTSQKVVVICLSGRSKPKRTSLDSITAMGDSYCELSDYQELVNEFCPLFVPPTENMDHVLQKEHDYDEERGEEGGEFKDMQDKTHLSSPPPPSRSVKSKLLSSGVEDNISIFDLYGSLDVETTRNLFKTILTRNPKSVILLCGRQIEELYSPRVATKEWEERVLIEDFN